MKNWLHNLAHRLGLTSGYVDHSRDRNGVWWVGLRCPKCGRFSHPVKSQYQDEPERGYAPKAPPPDHPFPQ